MKRYLQLNHRSGTPSALVAFDCETVPDPTADRGGAIQHRVFLIHATRWRREGGKNTRQEWARFTDHQSFWIWLLAGLEQRKRTWVFALNMAFDFTAARGWDCLGDGRLRLRNRKRRGPTECEEEGEIAADCPLLVTGDPPTVIDCEDARGRAVVFVDTMNYWPQGAAWVGEKLGLGKLDMPGELGSDSDWDAYCRRDVEIVQGAVNALFDWVKGSDLGNLQLTLAGQSMALFRHLQTEEQIVIDTDRHQKVWERRAYYGMHQRARFIGAVVRANTEGLRGLQGIPEGMPVLSGAPVWKLDVNACYPHVMKDQPYPTLSLRVEDRPSVGRLLTELDDFAAIAHVDIASEYVPYPLREGRDTIWHVGRFSTVLCGPELRRALESGHVSRVHAVQYFRQSCVFTRFIERIVEMRGELENSGQLLALAAVKQLGNALHGKFSQRGGGWVFVEDGYSIDPYGVHFEFLGEGKGVRCYRSVGHRIQEKMEPGETANSFPLIGAYVVAYAREHVRQLVAVAGEREVVYQDCDCLHTTDKGYRRLKRAGWIDPERSGALKVQGTADVVVYKGPKCYTWDEREFRSGTSKKGHLTPEGLWAQTDFARLDTILSGEPPPGPVAMERTIGPHKPTLHGSIDEDGWLEWPRRNG